MRRALLLCAMMLISCCHVTPVEPKPASPPTIQVQHPTTEELASASIDLADICLGILDHTAPEVAQINELLLRCVTNGVPPDDGPESCAHFACNAIRHSKLLDLCGPRERHKPWVDHIAY